MDMPGIRTRSRWEFRSSISHSKLNLSEVSRTDFSEAPGKIESENAGHFGKGVPLAARPGPILVPSPPETQLSKTCSHGSLAHMNDIKGTLESLLGGLYRGRTRSDPGCLSLGPFVPVESQPIPI